ncbi:MAG: cyclic nucleotide-binding domain-containing protein [Pseudomonadota bacterium]
MRKALYILGDLDDSDLIWLAKAGSVIHPKAGTEVIAAGNPINDLFIVTSGDLEVITPARKRIAELGVGDVVGEMSFVEKRSPSVSVQTKSDCRLLAIPRAALFEEFARNTGFAARFYRALAVFLSDRLRGMTEYGDDEVENELDEAILDNLHVAGGRMLRLIDILEGRVTA